MKESKNQNVNEEFKKFSKDNETMEEKVFEQYVAMRKSFNSSLNVEEENNLLDSPEFKAGFIAGLKILSSFVD